MGSRRANQGVCEAHCSLRGVESEIMNQVLPLTHSNACLSPTHQCQANKERLFPATS